MNVQKDKRKGLQSHTQKCIFVGYPGQYKGWRFLDLQTRKELISDTAVFDERVFPGNSNQSVVLVNPEDQAPSDPSVLVEFEEPVVATVAVEIAVVAAGVATAAAGTLVAVAAAALDPVAVVALQSVDLQQVADFLAEKPSPRFAPLVPVPVLVVASSGLGSTSCSELKASLARYVPLHRAQLEAVLLASPDVAADAL